MTSLFVLYGQYLLSVVLLTCCPYFAKLTALVSLMTVILI